MSDWDLFCIACSQVHPAIGVRAGFLLPVFAGAFVVLIVVAVAVVVLASRLLALFAG